MRKLPLIAAAVLAMSACTAPQTPSAEPPTAPAPTTQPNTPSPDPSVGSSLGEAAAPTATTAAAPARIRVPRVVGVNHQTAQDTMQAAGLFRLAEEDATGAGRMLLLDRNWVVVRQSPKAGSRVDPSTTITLYSKKIGE